MSKEKAKVFIELYNLSITDREDDRTGRVVTAKSLNEDDLIKIAVDRRTDLNASTIRAALDILKEVAAEEILNGASVQFGLAYHRLEVKGSFIGDHAQWDPEKNSLHLMSAPVAWFRNMIKGISVDVLGMSQSGTVINMVKDVTTGDENTSITAGGGVNLTGLKVRIAGDNADNGIKIINQTTRAIHTVPTTSILVNDPGRLSFIAPADLAAGDYKISVTTQFTGSGKMLKEPRTYVLEHVLSVGGGGNSGGGSGGGTIEE